MEPQTGRKYDTARRAELLQEFDHDVERWRIGARSTVWVGLYRVGIVGKSCAVSIPLSPRFQPTCFARDHAARLACDGARLNRVPLTDSTSHKPVVTHSLLLIGATIVLIAAGMFLATPLFRGV